MSKITRSDPARRAAWSASALLVLASSIASGQEPAGGQRSRPAPGDLLRPIGQARPLPRPPAIASAPSSTVRAAYLQGPDFNMPSAGATATPAPANVGPTGTAPMAPADPSIAIPPALQPMPGRGSAPANISMPSPGSAVPAPGLTPVPQSTNPTPLVVPSARGGGSSPSDLAPVAQPQLSESWATMGNCNLISPPSGYRAEFWNCGPSYVVPAGAPPYAYPQTIVPPTVMPGVVVPGAVMPTTPYVGNAGHRPLFTLGQENYNVQLGQGIIGQPTAYVPGQKIRNFIRYLSP